MAMQRDTALDVVKGACVVGMVFHHAWSYFPTHSGGIGYKPFISGLFLLMAGFVATHIYFMKYDVTKDWRRISQRLAVRGFKLLAIVVAANLALAMALNFHKTASLSPRQWLATMFFTGNYSTHTFAILVPIAYTLLAVGAMIALFRGRKAVFPIAAVIALAVSSIAYFDLREGYYVRYLSIGFTGAALGLIPHERMQRWLGNLSGALLAYGLLQLTLAYVPDNFPLYVVNVIVNLGFWYALGQKMSACEWVARKTILLGNYTLFCYLFQIVVLRVLHVILTRFPADHNYMVWAMILTTLIMWAAVEVLEVLRRRWRFLEFGYRIIFA
jgi:hypothetical protein